VIRRPGLGAGLAAVASLALAFGAASAEPSAPQAQGAHALTIALDPWSAVQGGQIFDAEDAFVFADAPRTPALGDDAIAVAVRIDRDRLAETMADDLAIGSSGGRVGSAFASFVALGPAGGSYASLQLARSGAASGVRLARTPVPSLVAMADPAR
jgi:hypothetical protein